MVGEDSWFDLTDIHTELIFPYYFFSFFVHEYSEAELNKFRSKSYHEAHKLV